MRSFKSIIALVLSGVVLCTSCVSKHGNDAAVEAVSPGRITNATLIAVGVGLYKAMKKMRFPVVEIHFGKLVAMPGRTSSLDVFWVSGGNRHLVFSRAGNLMFQLDKSNSSVATGYLEIKSEGRKFVYEGDQNLRPTMRQLAMEGASKAASLSLAMGKDIPKPQKEPYDQMISFLNMVMNIYWKVVRSDDIDELGAAITEGNRKWGHALKNCRDINAIIAEGSAKYADAMKWSELFALPFAAGVHASDKALGDTEVDEPLLQLDPKSKELEAATASFVSVVAKAKIN